MAEGAEKGKSGKLSSENVGGALGLLGTFLAGFGTDPWGVAAAAAAIASGLCFARFGHRSGGYSAAAALVAVCNVSLAFAPGGAQNAWIQGSLLAMAAVWSSGAFLWKLEELGSGGAAGWGKAAARLPKAIAWASLGLKGPGLAAAGISANEAMLAAFALWSCADVLVGRLHHCAGAWLRGWAKDGSGS